MIYLDYNATTPLLATARDAMLPYMDTIFGNASSIHAAGRQARAAIDNARDQVAALLKVKPGEIIFTGGGTESNNLGILGLARCHGDRGKHVISCRTEHSAVRNTVEQLEREGFSVTWLNVSPQGLIDLDHLRQSMTNETVLVSIMTANNETGVISPLPEISALCRERGVLLHSDMVQAFGKMNIDLSLVDAASFAAHKFYGPKGAGILYLRSGLPIRSIMFGGSHENQRRPGTENVSGIVGMAAAASELAENHQELARQSELRDRLWAGIGKSWPGAILNGAEAPRLPNTLNVSFMAVDSETLMIALDLEGICISSGSACMVGSVSASQVILAMGLSKEHATSVARLSLGCRTTGQEIDQAIAVFSKLAHRWRDRLGIRDGQVLAAAT